MRLLRHLAALRRHPSAILLAVRPTGVLLDPFIENTPGASASARSTSATFVPQTAHARSPASVGVMRLAAVVSRRIGPTLIRHG